MADMRLIDANALDLQNRVQTDMGGLCFIDDVEEAIEEVPTIDAVPVVRCKDCKFRKDVLDNGCFLCNRKMIGMVRPDDFCSFGERKEDGICKED